MGGLVQNLQRGGRLMNRIHELNKLIKRIDRKMTSRKCSLFYSPSVFLLKMHGIHMVNE